VTESAGVPLLNGGQHVALAGAVLVAVGLAAYGAAGSYSTISAKAVAVGVPLPELAPIGIDGGLVGVVVLDLVLAWTRHPVGWLRFLARLLTIGTVLANVSAGWPNLVAVGLHAAAPLMLLVMVEAGRAVLLRRFGLMSSTTRDRIPVGRWILSPWRTLLLWRRMVLWQVTSYRSALHLEARLRRARTLLKVRFGRRWRRKAPADVVWMLGFGPFVQEACAQVDKIVGSNNETATTSVVLSAIDSGLPGEVSAEWTSAGKVVVDDGQLEVAMRLNERHWAERNRPVSAETLRKSLRVGAVRARELTSAIRAMDKAVLGDRTPAAAS
jgi:hypothetical protein